MYKSAVAEIACAGTNSINISGVADNEILISKEGPLNVEIATTWGTNKRRFSVREQSHQAIEAHNRL
ncbi:unnamed protein product [Parnassius apollo]|uniref:(apollo) hypothetical protein n=1 Tax=Parnassius apollo TaxID=110799 RepID=A0A8S3WI31_PARAO|nr:unnamed protein product [Parnassius apollo]